MVQTLHGEKLKATTKRKNKNSEIHNVFHGLLSQTWKDQ